MEILSGLPLIFTRLSFGPLDSVWTNMFEQCRAHAGSYCRYNLQRINVWEEASTSLLSRALAEHKFALLSPTHVSPPFH
jgi:hypothetical protein